MSLWQYLVFFLIIGLVAIGNFGREAAKQTNTALEKLRTEQATANATAEAVMRALKPLEVFN